jgi:parallel beta-helix repeat protein
MCFLALVFGTRVCFAADKTTKLDSSYTVKGTKITVSGAKSGKIGSQVNKAVEYALACSKKNGKVYTIVVPKGNYKLERTIHVYGNIKLDLTGVKLTYTASAMKKSSDSAYGNMIMFGDSSINTNKKIMSGYGSYSNITIKGGTFVGKKKNTSALIRMAHCSNVTLTGCTLDGGGCAHQVEVAAIDGFTVKNCVFKNMNGNGTDRKQEAIQLDIAGTDFAFGGIVLDGTPMKNISVTGCTFRNVPRGVGTHSMIVGSYFKNVDISNNTFENVSEEAIIALNYINCTIKNNTIKNCGAGIVFETFKPRVQCVYSTVENGDKAYKGTIITDTKSVIANNTIKITNYGDADESVAIKVYGYNLEKATRATGDAESKQNSGVGDMIPAGNYYAGNVTIKNNKITTSGHGIHLMDAYDCVISSNTITSTEESGTKAHDAIMIEFASKNVTVKNNKINKAARYGILVQNSSKVKSITGNTINGAGERGIMLNKSATVTGQISGNTISNITKEGININSAQNDFAVSGNTVSGCGSWPIVMNNISTDYTITFTGNNLTSTANYAALQIAGGKAAVYENTLKEGKWGLCFGKGSTGEIGYNTMSGNILDVYMVLGSETKGTKKVSTVSMTDATATPAKEGMELTWGNVSGATGYTVTYSTSRDFSENVVTVKTAENSQVISGLESGKTYYVRITAGTSVNGVTVGTNCSNILEVTTE